MVSRANNTFLPSLAAKAWPGEDGSPVDEGAFQWVGEQFACDTSNFLSVLATRLAQEILKAQQFQPEEWKEHSFLVLEKMRGLCGRVNNLKDVTPLLEAVSQLRRLVVATQNTNLENLTLQQKDGSRKREQGGFACPGTHVLRIRDKEEGEAIECRVFPCFLAEKSSYFQRLFFGGMREEEKKEITIIDEIPEQLAEVIGWLMTGTFSAWPDEIPAHLWLAYKYDIESLIEHIRAQVLEGKVLHMLPTASVIDLLSLFCNDEHAFSFILKHFICCFLRHPLSLSDLSSYKELLAEVKGCVKEFSFVSLGPSVAQKIKKPFFLFLLDCCKNLEVLDLSQCISLDIEWNEIAKRCPQLKVLRIDKSKAVSFNQAIPEGIPGPSLEELSLNGCTHLTHSVLKQLLQRWPTMKKVNCRKCSAIEPEHIKWMRAWLPQLRSLAIGGDMGFNASLFVDAIVENLSFLEELDFSYTKLKLASTEALCRRLTQLRRLNLRDARIVGGLSGNGIIASLLAVDKRAPIELLDVRGRGNVSAERLRQFRSRWPDATILYDRASI